ncbi:MAG: FtsX-like permease family protein [Microscillaceae bacterium]|nr:FtsX-like permease family protein [Microscillaceae bacterium]
MSIYALVVAFFASVIFFTDALRQETQATLQKLPELWVQKLAGGRLVPMPLTMADSMRTFRGIKQVIPRIWGYNYDAPTGAVLTIIGSDSLPKGLRKIAQSSSARSQEPPAWVGAGLLRLRGLAVGESLTLLNDQGQLLSFEIRGTFESEARLLTHDLVVVPPVSARSLLGLAPEFCTDLGIEIHNPQEISNIGRKIDQRFAGLRVVSLPQLQATYAALFGWRGSLFLYGGMLSLLAFLILAWEKAAGRSREDQHLLGLLKALGWEISDVLWFKFWEGFLISFQALLLGLLMAYIHVFWAQAPLLKPLLAGWSVLYPDYPLLPTLRPASVLLIAVLALFPYLVATWSLPGGVPSPTRQK